MTVELLPPQDPLAGPGPQPEPPPAPAPVAPVHPVRHPGVTPKLVLGIGVIFLGIALTLDQLNLVDMGLVMKLSPLILVAMGVVKLRQCPDRLSGPGYWLVLAGVFLLAVNFGPGRIVDALWPLGIVALGVFLVLRALRQHRRPSEDIRRTQGLGDAWASGTAIFGAFKRRVGSQDFQGGDVTAIFGGFELDLLNAKAGRSPMMLDLFVLFGGGEIHVPEGWDVEVHATSIFGSVEQKQYRPSTPDPDRPRLVVTGTTLFGGVEIRH
ncbi:MAG TPA: LiaF domain-containing protein [Holophagaceae bacterium]|nr:LiaF domain-containing protein [Holophagaceae bacterium]